MSWLRDYLIYTSHQESPEIFHFWAGMTAIAAASKKNIWLDRRTHGVTYYKVYPGQLMTILIGDSGLVKKSTAVKPIKKFIPPNVKVIIGGKNSAEAFLDELDPKKGGEPQSFLIEDEFAIFLSKATYAEGLVNIFLRIYDAEDLPFRTRGRGKILIPNPCLTVLGCTTPHDLGNAIPPGVTAEAFKSRLLFVYAKDTDRIDALTDIDDAEISAEELKLRQAIEKRLKEGLEKISYSAGPFSFTERGKKWFIEWHKNWRNSPMGRKDGYPSRRPDHMLRTAMLLVISKTLGEPTELVLDEDDLVKADAALTQLEQNFDDVFLYVGTTYNKNRERVIDALHKHGGMADTKTLVKEINRYFPDMESIKRTFHVLEQSGAIRVISKKSQNNPEIWGLVK